MKLLIFRITLLLLLISQVAAKASITFATQPDTLIQDTAAFVSPYEEDNQHCFKCHGQSKYSYMNESLGREVKAMMFSERIVRKDEFYKSNHKSFSCTDCHSAEYTAFPHPGELRMEVKLNCIDCHGGDETYHFDAIASK